MQRDHPGEGDMAQDSFNNGGHPFCKTDARYWKRRLIHRKYVDLARRKAGAEYFARIEYEGAGVFFPLGSTAEPAAAAKALEIYLAVLAKGWTVVGRMFSQEFTLAIFWANNPVACTYTTLLTELCDPISTNHSTRRAMESAVGVLIIETNEEIRRALTLWVNRIPGYHCAGAFSNAQAALRPAAVKSAGLILFNRNLPGLPEGKGLAECDGRIAGLPAFGFGTYAESDDIFSSLTGVSGGYFLRRRPPLEMLEPITGAWNQGALAAQRLVGQIQKYFQNLFGQSPPGDDAQSKVRLTPREQEILLRLSKGYPDKQIADGLNISAWTVHNHMKNIFKKLDVHTRTEAVIRYLQK